MNAKKRKNIEKKAKATVAKRHTEPAAAPAGDFAPDTATPAPKVAKVAKAAKEPKEGALPALPKLPSAKRTRKPRPTQPCACGCETPTASKWAPGHDARAKGWALRINRNICKMSDVPANEQAGAKLMLAELKTAGTGGKITLAKGNKGAAPETVTEPAATGTDNA